MNIQTTNYSNTFIAVSADCPAMSGMAPASKERGNTIAGMQFSLLRSNPYKYSSDDVLFQVYADRNDLTMEEYESARASFFSKGQPCLRTSPLTKRYGWGVHFNAEGKVAIYGCETEAYQSFLNDKSVQQVKAMRNAKA